MLYDLQNFLNVVAWEEQELDINKYKKKKHLKNRRNFSEF